MIRKILLACLILVAGVASVYQEYWSMGQTWEVHNMLRLVFLMGVLVGGIFVYLFLNLKREAEQKENMRHQIPRI